LLLIVERSQRLIAAPIAGTEQDSVSDHERAEDDRLAIALEAGADERAQRAEET
jgi:hypothetical protein